MGLSHRRTLSKQFKLISIRIYQMQLQRENKDIPSHHHQQPLMQMMILDLTKRDLSLRMQKTSIRKQEMMMQTIVRVALERNERGHEYYR